MVDDPLALGVDRVRVAGAVAADDLGSWRAAGLDVDLAPPVAVAWEELRHWVRGAESQHHPPPARPPLL
ncbi:MAG: hypothetical protein R2713_05495 [Ilumatobacteraceae bacterium]